jgi:hypothetical protein
MKTNTFKRTPVFTHEGAQSSEIPPLQKLKRLCMTTMLWEDTFYVDGKTAAEQIAECCEKIHPDKIRDLALEVHSKGMLRHMPLFLILQALKKGSKCKEAISEICRRPDQITELISLYWKDGKKSLPAQMKKGLAQAFLKFDEYQLAKYDRDTPVKLRDALFLCHAKPSSKEQDELWKKLIDRKLAIPETWETKLSSGADKKEAFQELLIKGKMGKLAIIRNLRNMHDSGIHKELVEDELLKNSRPLLPFQFIAAAKECPNWEEIIDKAMIQSCKEKEKLSDRTLVLVDVSGSMGHAISAKSKMSRLDAAYGIAILLKEICIKIGIASFSNELVPVPPRQGMALRDAIEHSQSHQQTNLGRSLAQVIQSDFDRCIVITDEQSHDAMPKMSIPRCYIINVGTYENGIKNDGHWHIINGFSENVIDYIIEYEKASVTVQIPFSR